MGRDKTWTHPVVLPHRETPCKVCGQKWRVRLKVGGCTRCMFGVWVWLSGTSSGNWKPTDEHPHVQTRHARASTDIQPELPLAGSTGVGCPTGSAKLEMCVA